MQILLDITDDYSRFTKVEILHTKDETFAAYKNFAAWAQTQHEAQIKRLRSDRGGEFMSQSINLFLASADALFGPITTVCTNGQIVKKISWKVYTQLFRL
jgi:hypothetical protein